VLVQRMHTLVSILRTYSREQGTQGGRGHD
jgi:hypothetical protein